MADRKNESEQRKQKRFRVKDDASVILRSPDAGMGRLIDISMGGLTFEYVTNQAPPIEATSVDIVLTDNAFTLDNIPCRKIWSLTLYQTRQTSLHAIQYGVKFGELTPQQENLLKYLIDNHTVEEL
jgi:hypothetical protein